MQSLPLGHSPGFFFLLSLDFFNLHILVYSLKFSYMYKMYLDHIHPSLCPSSSPQDHPPSNLRPLSGPSFITVHLLLAH